MWEQYHAHMESQNKEKVQSEENKLSRVTGMWQTRVSWWERDFNFQPEPPVSKSKKMRERRSERDMDDLPDGASLQMAMPSAPMSSQSRARRSSLSMASPAPPPPAMSSPAPMMADMAMEEECLADEDDEAAEGASGDFGGSSASSPGISGVGVKVQAWDPATPYIKTLAELGDRKLPALYKVYLSQRDSESNNYANSPAFYFDCAHYFLNQSSLGAVESRTLGVRILTNIPELKLEEPQLLRMLGYKLDEMNELDLAIEVFGKVLKLRPDEPQSHRDLALVLEKRANPGDYQRAVNLLWAVVVGPSWRSDFDEVEITALVEMNALIAKAERNKVDIKRPERSGPFIKNLACDLRISMGWDTDNTDFDLHVVEPNGTGFPPLCLTIESPLHFLNDFVHRRGVLLWSPRH
jgi:Ca-activated chloride channel homolog